MKKEYEMVFIVKPIEKKQFEVAIQKIENIITDNGDDIKVTERWGKKTLHTKLMALMKAYLLLLYSKLKRKL